MLLVIRVESAHVIEGYTIDIQQVDIRIHSILSRWRRVASASRGKLEMEAREAGLAHFAAEVFHCLRGFFRRAEALDEEFRIEHGKDRTAVDLDIVRKVEILSYYAFHDLFPVFHPYARAEKDVFVVAVDVIVPVVVFHLMVGVHEIEVHLAV